MCLIETNNNVLLTQLIQLTNDYPKILTEYNTWIIGITQERSTRDYYLVFYNDMDAVLSRTMRITYNRFMQYDNFYEIEEIGSGGYGTVYTAKHKIDEFTLNEVERVVLKKFKNFDKNRTVYFRGKHSHVILITALIMHIRVNRVFMKVILI